MTERDDSQREQKDRQHDRLERAKARKLWLDSPERQQSMRVARVATCVVLLVSVLVGLSYYWLNNDYYVESVYSTRELVLAALASGGLCLFILGFIAFYVWGFYRMIMRKTLSDSVLIAESEAALREAEDVVGANLQGLELSSLWSLTHSRLDYYHQIATRQAEASFRNSQLAMASGFAVVTLSIFISLIPSSTTSNIVAGVLGATAAALSGFVSRTFLHAQETASAQLRGYFLQPLEFSRYLVAERLLGTLPEEKRPDGIMRLVEGIASVRGENESK